MSASAWRFSLAVLWVAFAARADEGMWTFNNFPATAVAQKYGVKIDSNWLEHVRLSSARLARGCSGSFVSPNGLVLTNHHCVHSCVEQLSTPQKDLIKEGFWAAETKDELQCPGMEINQLLDITDVTARVQSATAGVALDKFADAQRAEFSKIEKECATSDELRCDVVTLYRGGRFDLYKYRRVQDVRLAFAPEFGIAFFGGDPDNFNFPRYNLDAAFLRVYGKDGKPLAVKHHLRWSESGAKAGEPTFVSGHPGGTSRLKTVAQLELDRDVVWPQRLMRLSELRGFLTEYQRRGDEQRRHSNGMLFSVENSIKALRGRHAALADPNFFAGRVAWEKKLRAQVEGKPQLRKQYGGAWAGVSDATLAHRRLAVAYQQLEGGPGGTLFAHARALVRLAEELPKPNDRRLPEFSESRLPQLKQSVLSNAPIHKEFEEALLSFGLTKMREELGADDPSVKKILGLKSPAEVAKELVSQTQLGDVAARQKLWASGGALLDSQDAMVAFVRLWDADARFARTVYEREVDGPLKKFGEQLAKAHFAVSGTQTYPDATFTLRLSYGAVDGFSHRGAKVTPLTTFEGAYGRHTGREPFALPKRWLDKKAELPLSTPFNLVTSNDIIGGNSGSPLINAKAELVGLVFDGNIYSLGGEYGFDADQNRAISVHSSAILEALNKVYGATNLVKELKPPGIGAAGIP